MKGKGGRMGLGDPEDPEGLASFVFGHVRYLWTSPYFLGCLIYLNILPFFGWQMVTCPYCLLILNISWKLPEMEEYGTIHTMVSSCFIHSLWFCSYSVKKKVKINFLGRADTKSTSSHRLDFQLKGIYSHIHVYTLQLSRASKLWVTLRCLIYRTCISGCLPANLARTHLRIKRNVSFPAFATKRRQSEVSFGGHLFTRKFVHLSCGMAHRSTCLMR